MEKILKSELTPPPRARCNNFIRQTTYRLSILGGQNVFTDYIWCIGSARTSVNGLSVLIFVRNRSQTLRNSTKMHILLQKASISVILGLLG